jgi:hypothetical protein
VTYLNSVALRPEFVRRGALTLQVTLSRHQLDMALANGADPGGRPELALRASQLVKPKQRLRLAASIDRLLKEADQGRPALSAAVPIQRDQVKSARAALVSFAQALRAPEEVKPRGIAMLWKLITDPLSPVYMQTARGRLHLQVEAAGRHLLLDRGH